MALFLCQNQMMESPLLWPRRAPAYIDIVPDNNIGNFPAALAFPVDRQGPPHATPGATRWSGMWDGGGWMLPSLTLRTGGGGGVLRRCPMAADALKVPQPGVGPLPPVVAGSTALTATLLEA